MSLWADKKAESQELYSKNIFKTAEARQNQNPESMEDKKGLEYVHMAWGNERQVGNSNSVWPVLFIEAGTG